MTVNERKQNYSHMPDTELYLAYDAAILVLVTDQIPGPNIRYKLEFMDSITHEINEN